MTMAAHMDETEIIEDFKRELSIWQQEIEVDANHSVIPKELEIPITIFFFHYDRGTSIAYRHRRERAELPNRYLKLGQRDGFGKDLCRRSIETLQQIKEVTGGERIDAAALKVARQHMLRLWPAYLFGYNLPRFEEKGVFYPRSQTEQENLSFAKEIRKISEGIYDRVEEAIRRTTDSLFQTSRPSSEILHGCPTIAIFQAIAEGVLPTALTECVIDEAGLHTMKLDEYLQFKSYRVYREDHSHVEVKGAVASTGGFKKVKGRARIVKKADLPGIKIEPGEILATLATSPDFVPLMKTAAGIVTDEGGLLSHAAIVSRELNKPCIVQTKTATKILRDGDLIEMDLETGGVAVISE